MKSNIISSPDSQAPAKEKFSDETALQQTIRKASEERERNSRKRTGCETMYWTLTRTGYYDKRIDSLTRLQASRLYLEGDWVFVEDTNWDDFDHWVTVTYCLHRENFSAEEWERFASAHVCQRQREVKEAESERKERKAEIEREARKARRQQTAQLRRRAGGR